MIWDSWSDFFAMGGYALYVWGSLIAVFSLMLCEVVVLTVRGRSIRKELAGINTSNMPYPGDRP
jgi:heme exporter protein D